MDCAVGDLAVSCCRGRSRCSANCAFSSYPSPPGPRWPWMRRIRPYLDGEVCGRIKIGFIKLKGCVRILHRFPSRTSFPSLPLSFSASRSRAARRRWWKDRRHIGCAGRTECWVWLPPLPIPGPRGFRSIGVPTLKLHAAPDDRRLPEYDHASAHLASHALLPDGWIDEGGGRKVRLQTCSASR